MRAAALLLFLALLSPLAETAAPKRVLILHSFGRDFAPFNAIAPALRTELARQLKQPVAFYEASLDTERIGPPGDEHALVDFLRSHHGTTQPDLVVVLAASALRFYLRHRERLFPDAPLLVTGIAERRLQDIQLGSRDRVVSVNSDIRVIANNILKVLPETGTLAVVQGSSRIDRLERVEFQSQLAPLASRVKLIWLHDLTIEQLRERVATLPPDSAIVYGHFAVDAAGVPYENERALAAVLEVANAPVFGMYDSQLGAGIVGGPLRGTAQDGRGIGTDRAAHAGRRSESRRGYPGAGGRYAGIRLAGAATAGAFPSRGCRPAPRCASGRLPSGSSTGC